MREHSQRGDYSRTLTNYSIEFTSIENENRFCVVIKRDVDMKNIKMIVTDLDNTLLRRDKTISAFTESVLRQCLERGISIVFATARPERATRQWQIHHPLCYVIANNGATITQGQKEILNISISENTKHSIFKEFIDDKSVSGICAETGELLYCNENSYLSWDTTYPKDTGWNLVFNDFCTPLSENICKLSVECSQTERVLAILQRYPDLRVFPNSGEQWYQITHISASKFNAISYLSRITDTVLQDIMVFGDDFNDVEMLEKCGVGIAVGNAVIDAKRATDFLCDTNDNDGVARYISENILNNK